MNSKLALAVITATVTFASQFASAAGYEKNIMWSGRAGGQGGASLSVVEGSEALYWNPAGLVSSRVGQDVSLNVSPTQAQFQGSISADQENRSSDQQTSFPFGLIYGATLNEKWGFGVGGYVSGGTSATYENVPFTSYSLRPEVKSDLQLVEIAAGVGYRVNEQWRLGAAWRAALVNADFSSAGPNAANTALVATQFKDLEAQEFTGFKVGAQYIPSEVWGLGLSVRTAIEFEAEGDAAVQIQAPAQAPTGAFTSRTGTAKIKSTFPLQANIGGHWNVVPDAWRAYLEYGYTQYSEVEQLEITTAVPGIPAQSTIPQNWDDQHHVRLAGEFLGMSWPVRFGYVFTSQVVPEADARATFSAPGIGHTLTVGTGHKFMEDMLRFDAGLEHSWITGDVGNNVTPAVGGKYETVGTALHLGLAYLF